MCRNIGITLHAYNKLAYTRSRIEMCTIYFPRRYVQIMYVGVQEYRGVVGYILLLRLPICF